MVLSLLQHPILRMKSSQKKTLSGDVRFTSVDEYHRSFEGPVLARLDELRAIIRRVVPEAQETISFNMPAFRMKKILVYYAAHKSHIGLYPTASPIIAFREELKRYKTSRGAIQFPADEPLPFKLISRIVAYRATELTERT